MDGCVVVDTVCVSLCVCVRACAGKDVAPAAEGHYDRMFPDIVGKPAKATKTLPSAVVSPQASGEVSVTSSVTRTQASTRSSIKLPKL